MHVKVDFSIDCKENGYNIMRPGCYAVYIRKHFWDKWTQIETYADLEFCKSTASRMAKLPIKYR